MFNRYNYFFSLQCIHFQVYVFIKQTSFYSYSETGFNEFEPGLETVQPHILNQDTHKNRR